MGGFPTGTVTFVFTDVVDSTRLWEQQPDDMDGAMASHDQIVNEAAANNSGVLVKHTGDGVHLVFPSAMDAVTAAIEIQERLKEIGELPLAARIGVHTGEARLRDGDYYGQAVNRAARVMSTSEGGQILLSLTTEELVRDGLPDGATLRDLGDRDLEGLSRPERVFELATSPAYPPPVPSTGSEEAAARRAAWIAVLPFQNMSGDPEQDYFAHGIAEDVITGLAAWSTLRVIARSSSFRDLGLPVGQIADELGVRYVLEGSVRRAADRVRVSAQLIDAKRGHHLWAERYDAEMVDIFELQDQITRSIVVAIDPAIRTAEAERASRARPDSFDAWDHVQRGWSEFFRFKKEGHVEARRHFAAAVELDPEYADPHAAMAWVYGMDAWLRWVDDPVASLELAHKEAKKALELDRRNAMCHTALALTSYAMGRLETAAEAADRAIALNPSLAWGYMLAGASRIHGGHPEEGTELVSQAIDLSPHDPMANWFYGARAMAYFMLRQYQEAIDDARAALKIRYGYLMGRVVLTASLSEMGDADSAQKELGLILELRPEFSTALLDLYTFKKGSDRQRLIDGLHAAGLPAHQPAD